MCADVPARLPEPGEDCAGVCAEEDAVQVPVKGSTDFGGRDHGEFRAQELEHGDGARAVAIDPAPGVDEHAAVRVAQVASGPVVVVGGV